MPNWTREGLKKHWELVEHFKNDGELERYNPISSKWIDTPNPSFDDDVIYRKKPVKKTVPWDAEDYKCGMVLLRHGNKGTVLINAVELNGSSVKICAGTKYYNPGDMPLYFTLEDGTPLTKEVEEEA